MAKPKSGGKQAKTSKPRAAKQQKRGSKAKPAKAARASKARPPAKGTNAKPVSNGMSTAKAKLSSDVFLPLRVVHDLEGDAFPSTRLDEHARDEGVLSSTTFADIRGHAGEGVRLFDADDVGGAFRAFLAALELLPAPMENWNAAGWLLVAMGECAVRGGDFARAFPPLRDAMHCPGTIGNPWVHLRLGQVRFELGDARAADELARAYMGGGREIFAELDPKYFALVEKTLEPPPGHDRLR